MILEKIASNAGVSVAALEILVATASHRYKTYKIAKRTGGFREINHPSVALKFMQRWLARNVFEHLPIHVAAKAYRTDVSIRNLAEPHVAKNYLLRMDFANFFPSLTSDDVKKLLVKNTALLPFVLSQNDLEIISKIVCRFNRLTIGAPSSPILSNNLLFGFDQKIQEVCASKNVTYTRYADDLFFSTNHPNALREISNKVLVEINELPYPRLQINAEKTIFTSRKRKRMVTGLVLTSDRKISVGRKKKRLIHHQMNEYKYDQLDPPAISYLRGYLAYVGAVEPTFIESLKAKYGEDLLKKLFQARLTERK